MFPLEKSFFDGHRRSSADRDVPTIDEDGYVTVPNRPSIGYELNMDLLNRLRVGKKE